MVTKRVHIAGALPFEKGRVLRIVTAANAFQAGVLLKYPGGTINGKSMLGLLTVGLNARRDYDLVCRGEDEQEALDRLSVMLEDEEPVSPSGDDRIPE